MCGIRMDLVDKMLQQKRMTRSCIEPMNRWKDEGIPIWKGYALIDGRMDGKVCIPQACIPRAVREKKKMKRGLNS